MISTGEKKLFNNVISTPANQRLLNGQKKIEFVNFLN
jgi:hypothetical protein